MPTQIKIVTRERIAHDFLAQVRTWVNEVLERAGPLSSHSYVRVTIWKTLEKLQAFYREEKEALGVVTGEETDYLATHDAWRGYPRIHICQERLKEIPEQVVQGVIHHETSHALHHGSPEFYTFRFSSKLQEAGRSCGLDLALLQQCVYFLSVAIKDQEVVQWLVERGLAFGQIALLKYLLSETEEEARVWEVARGSSGLRRIAAAAFLKPLLPIESMISAGRREAEALKNCWNEAYGWLSEGDKETLVRLAQCIMNLQGETFQERLEQAAFLLLSRL